MIQDLIPILVTTVLDKLIKAPSVPVTQENAAAARPAVEKAVRETVRDEIQPRIDHLTNNEPWYQSRVTIGAIMVLIGVTLRAFGYEMSDEERTTWEEIVFNILPFFLNAGGAALALVGRWLARKPMGSTL